MKVKTSSAIPRSPTQTQRLMLLKRVVISIARHWLLIVNLLIGLWVALPWFAPIFMHWSWTSAGKAIYLAYSFQCHQLPERSFFLFGRQAMYSLNVIQAAWQQTTDPLILRQFIGNPEMGWKVAWSDRMVSMYTMLFLSSLGYGLLRNRLKPLPMRVFFMLLFPMAIDGTTHALSDLAGIGQGFRDTNVWLQIITSNAFSTTFYQGDALGSFNSWMRLITGVLFGIGLVGFAFPYVNDAFTDIVRRSEATLMKGLG
jgi:uncharacterized membrane protein